VGSGRAQQLHNTSVQQLMLWFSLDAMQMARVLLYRSVKLQQLPKLHATNYCVKTLVVECVVSFALVNLQGHVHDAQHF
jgi:hypothetical protein